MELINNFIDNEFIPPVGGRYLDNLNPATGKVYSKLADSTDEDVAMAVTAAQRAFPQWSKILATERSQILNKIADLIDQNRKALALAESKDQGKTFSRAFEIEIPRASLNFRFFASAIIHQKEMSTTSGNLLNYTLREPVGVAGLISPWNLPLYLLTWKIAPALAYGNTAVCKPSELTPMTAFMLASILKEAGLPKGVCNIVFGTGERAGSALVEHPDVPLISFTGGTVTGEKIYKAAAKNFKKLSLELGGKNPNIIFADANMKQCVPTTILSSFANQGEICLCGSRIYVQEPIFDEFVAALKLETEKLVVGDPLDAKTFVGPLISLQHLEKVLGSIEQARGEGAKIITGGQRLKLSGEFEGGYFLKPTIITDLNPNSKLMQTEIFGPVVSVTPFKQVDEVIAMANSGPYGLAAIIWTQDISKAHKVAAQIRAGTVWINTWMKRDLRVPFGGMRASGLGREGGEHSIEFFTETKTVSMEL